ncbi:MAG: lytic transglycosylase domain-containing protein [Candidatus Solibacter sp.]
MRRTTFSGDNSTVLRLTLLLAVGICSHCIPSYAGNSADDPRWNLAACRTGLAAACNEKLLTPEQIAEVRQAALRRNATACMARPGLSCDEKLLTPGQVEQVKEAALRRNAGACISGLAAACNPTLLTAEQAEQVHKAVLQRNYLACRMGLTAGCDHTLLAPEQSANIEETARQRASRMSEFRSLIGRRSAAPVSWRTTRSFAFFASPPPCPRISEAEITPIIDTASRANQLQDKLIRGVMQIESAFHPCAVSPKGAMGLMQLMPATAAQFGVTNPFDAHQSVEAGARLLKQLMDRYNGNLALVLAAYNAGPARVDQTGGVPDIKETKEYVAAFMRLVR